MMEGYTNSRLLYFTACIQTANLASPISEGWRDTGLDLPRSYLAETMVGENLPFQNSCSQIINIWMIMQMKRRLLIHFHFSV